MKMEEPIDTSPWKSILWGVAFFLFFTLILLSSSCTTLESIPFSVSYQLQDGSAITISKPRIIREK